MKCKTLTLLLVIWVLSTIALALADVHYTANTYPFTFPTYDTAMGFNTDQTFNNQGTNRTSDYWYFNKTGIDNYGFRLTQSSGTGAQLLITDYFLSDSDELKFSVTASAGITSTTKIYVPIKGTPSSVSGASSWSFDVPTKILTINVVHASTVAITVTWGGGDSTAPTYDHVAHNTTIATQPCKFSSEWTDNIGLSGYYFSYNGTGAWANETFTAFSSNPGWANKTKTLPAAGTVVGYRWYANDTSGNWNLTSIYTLTTTAVGQNIVVLLGSPSDGTTLYTNSISFQFTPIFSSTIQNASLWTNVTGSWAVTKWNSTIIQNNTANTIANIFSASGIIKWNIAAYNTTNYVMAASNRTFTLILEPRGSSLTHSTTRENTNCTFSGYWIDGDGLSGYIFSWKNGTNPWANETWTAFGGSPLTDTAVDFEVLPNIDVTIQYCFYANDTENRWGASSIDSFMTTPLPPGLSGLGIQYLLFGDIIGFIISTYTSQIGVAFYGIIGLSLFGVFYNRTKSLAFISIMWLLLAGAFAVYTMEFSPVAVVMVVMGLVGIVYSVFDKESG